jgi:hypothetical protein
MEEQLKQEKASVHERIFRKMTSYAEEETEIISIQRKTTEKKKFFDFVGEVRKNNIIKKFVIEGKRDCFASKNIVSELFGCVPNYFYNFNKEFKDSFSTRISIQTNENLYNKVWKVIYNIRNDSRSKSFWGYGLADIEDIAIEKRFPIFSYYWVKYSKAALFKGSVLNRISKDCLDNKDKDCFLLLTPNKTWTTINLLIPWKKVMTNECCIKEFPYNEDYE